MTSPNLIDFTQLPNGLISGFSDEEITEISALQQLIRDDPDFFNDLGDYRHLSNEHLENLISDDIKTKLDVLQQSSIPRSTAEHQKRYSEKFVNFLKEKGMNINFSSLPKTQIAEYLRYFYSELRTVEGKLYSPATLICIRAALFRFFKQPPLSMDINIIDDSAFFNANQILKAMVKKHKEEGGITRQYNAIEDSDIQKMVKYFDRQDPEKLQQEVYFAIVYYLGNRGREWIRFLKKENVMMKHDSEGMEYVEITGLNAIQKNSQPSLKKEQNILKQSRIYASTNASSCPVKAVQLLLNKLPQEAEYLFYRKSANWRTETVWYNHKMPMGVNGIADLMKKISTAANLSKTYTSHCIRPTVVSTLFNEGISTNDIQCVTGHQSQNSVNRYIKRVNDSKKLMYAKALQKPLQIHQGFSNDGSNSKYF